MNDVVYYKRLKPKQKDALNSVFIQAFRHIISNTNNFLFLTSNLFVNYQFYGHNDKKSYLFLCVKEVSWVDVGVIEIPVADYEIEKKVIEKMFHSFIDEEYYCEVDSAIKWVSDNYGDYLEEECEEVE